MGATLIAAIALVMSCGGSIASGPCAAHELLCGGTCLDVQSDNQHCGGCEVRCGDTERCVGGQCQAGCGASEVACGGYCVDLSGDPSNCGACGNVCGERTSCVGGACGARCPKGQTPCRDAGPCVDPMTDNANCGACGAQCGPGRLCVAGACVARCTAGQSYCKDSGGYTCVDSRNDPKNCGRCWHDCLGSTCSDGACDPVALVTAQDRIIEMTLDATNLYWTLDPSTGPNGGSVMSCAVGGCNDTPTALATGRDYPGTVVSDGQTVYWTENRTGVKDGVYSCDRGGCSNQPSLLAKMSYGSRDRQMMALGASQLYWMDQGYLVTCLRRAAPGRLEPSSART